MIGVTKLSIRLLLREGNLISKKHIYNNLKELYQHKRSFTNNTELIHKYRIAALTTISRRDFSKASNIINNDDLEDFKFYVTSGAEPNTFHLKEYSKKPVNQKNSNNDKNTKLIVNPLTRNLTLISDKPRKLNFEKNNITLQSDSESPLCVLFGYMMAKKKHLLKYAKIYTDLGFDVLLVEITPWQLLWPTKGSQLVASDVLNFLYGNLKQFFPLVIHGFSVGGYQWGEVMAIMSREQSKYEDLLSKIRAQTWDSAADISEIPVGLPKAIFPNNLTLQNALRNYAIYHLKTFYNIATVHYARSSNFFHFPLLKCPCLFMVSEQDPVGSVKSNWSVKEDMESIGIKTTWQCWNDSKHVMHYLKHPEQYVDLIYKHLRETNVLEDVARKTRIAKV